ncbi:hypothetical protein BDV36DRAFT_258791 [Aspergillus pseudocaelatus]|uniref:Secreted protein n=1 Tax=Aspergillus pseudocaelatus TaxID=1825620 RepID=A0ABQ6WIH1_9EURO|nr:hypothetical protein BDV36DRAFT_258791 [Aspergillus pseudocaelatus]
MVFVRVVFLPWSIFILPFHDLSVTRENKLGGTVCASFNNCQRSIVARERSTAEKIRKKKEEFGTSYYSCSKSAPPPSQIPAA